MGTKKSLGKATERNDSAHGCTAPASIPPRGCACGGPNKGFIAGANLSRPHSCGASNGVRSSGLAQGAGSTNGNGTSARGLRACSGHQPRVAGGAGGNAAPSSLSGAPHSAHSPRNGLQSLGPGQTRSSLQSARQQQHRHTQPQLQSEHQSLSPPSGLPERLGGPTRLGSGVPMLNAKSSLPSSRPCGNAGGPALQSSRMRQRDAGRDSSAAEQLSERGPPPPSTSRLWQQDNQRGSDIHRLGGSASAIGNNSGGRGVSRHLQPHSCALIGNGTTAALGSCGGAGSSASCSGGSTGRSTNSAAGAGTGNVGPHGRGIGGERPLSAPPAAPGMAQPTQMRSSHGGSSRTGGAMAAAAAAAAAVASAAAAPGNPSSHVSPKGLKSLSGSRQLASSSLQPAGVSGGASGGSELQTPGAACSSARSDASKGSLHSPHGNSPSGQSGLHNLSVMSTSSAGQATTGNAPSPGAGCGGSGDSAPHLKGLMPLHPGGHGGNRSFSPPGAPSRTSANGPAPLSTNAAGGPGANQALASSVGAQAQGVSLQRSSHVANSSAGSRTPIHPGLLRPAPRSAGRPAATPNGSRGAAPSAAAGGLSRQQATSSLRKAHAPGAIPPRGHAHMPFRPEPRVHADPRNTIGSGGTMTPSSGGLLVPNRGRSSSPSFVEGNMMPSGVKSHSSPAMTCLSKPGLARPGAATHHSYTPVSHAGAFHRR